MALKDDIKALLKEIKDKGRKRSEMCKYIDVTPRSLSTILSRGGNKTIYNKILKYVQHIRDESVGDKAILEALTEIKAQNRVIMQALSRLSSGTEKEAEKQYKSLLKKVEEELKKP